MKTYPYEYVKFIFSKIKRNLPSTKKLFPVGSFLTSPFSIWVVEDSQPYDFLITEHDYRGP